MCLGTMMFGEHCTEAEAALIVDAALDAGVNFIDTAPMYANCRTEEILGRILRGKRDRVFLVTKVNSVTSHDILTGIDESLKRLQTDHVDLYLIHWPKEPMNPLQVMKALDRVVRTEKTRLVGCSNYPAWLLAHSNLLAQANGLAAFTAHQVPYNLVERGIEVEVIPQALAEQIGLMTYRPLLAGTLSGKYLSGKEFSRPNRGLVDKRIAQWTSDYAGGIRKLVHLAREKSCTPSQLAIAWVRSRSSKIFPIVGVSSLPQLQESIGAFAIQLSSKESDDLARAFDAEVWEEAGGAYKGLRRSTRLLT